MNHQRLHWRIGLPFALFVLAGSVVLVLWMSWRGVDAERGRLASLAQSNAEFLRQSHLPPSERMARQLGDVLNAQVVFVRGEEFVPNQPLWAAPKSALDVRDMPADGRVRVGVGFQHEAVKCALSDGWTLVLWWPRLWPWSHVFARESLLVLGAFWLLALGFGWLVARSLVRPLRHLAARLPDIEKPEPIDLPEAGREDEIGDVARAFVRTREALRTERVERERAEKLAVLGRMTAALAHEIQNPVAAIKMHAQLWQGEGGGETAQVIEHEAARIESLVNQWMFLSRPQPPAMSAVDVSALLAQVVKTHQAQCDHAQVRLQLNTGDNLGVQGDVKRLAQVFSNILVNGIQSMPHGGQMTVTSALATPWMEVSFADTGRGFSSEALARFSEFFFSEKEGGMGIGLSVASEIVKAHAGELRVANRPEGGACVTVKLPALETRRADAGSFSIAD